MRKWKMHKPSRFSYQTIPMPCDMIRKINAEIRKTHGSFSDFVVEAVRAALAEIEKAKRKDL